MYSGSISEHRINLCIPPPVMQSLNDDARLAGLRTTEYLRHVLLKWNEERTVRLLRQQGRL